MLGNLSLHDFQHAFAQALRAPPDTAPAAGIATIATQPGFAVYRNTVIKGMIDALQANYPAVARLTGDDWFRAAAAMYVREAPPHDPVLLHYGASFPDFLTRFPPAQELPYLAGVARLDRLWSEAHTARDDTLLDADALTRLAPAALAEYVLYPHAAARWAWFEHAPIFSIWSRNRADDFESETAWQPDWHAEGALLTRAHGNVEWMALDAAGYTLIQRCADGGTLAQAADAALAANAAADLHALMAALLRAGAFSRMSRTRISTPQ